MDLTAMLGASFVGAFLYAFTTLLPVINPFSGAMFFVTLTGHLSDADRSYVAGRIALFSLIILMVCLFAGHIILGFFGISVGVLRCAGGIVLFAAGWNALNTSTRWNLKSKDGAASFKTEGYGFLSIHFAAYYGTRSDCSNSCYWHNTAVQLFQSGRHNSCNSCCSRCDLALLPLWGQSQSSCWSCRSRCFSSYFCLHFDLPWCGSLLAGLY